MSFQTALIRPIPWLVAGNQCRAVRKGRHQPLHDVSCRIGYPIPMFAGFCIMFISTVSKYPLTALRSKYPLPTLTSGSGKEPTSVSWESADLGEEGAP